MIVPDLAVEADLNIPDSAFNQSARHDAAPRVIIRARVPVLDALQAGFLSYTVHLERFLALLRNVQGSACLDLHAGSQLIACYTRVDLWLPGVVELVSMLQSVHQPAPQLNQLWRIVNFRSEIQDRIAGRSKPGSLIDRR